MTMYNETISQSMHLFFQMKKLRGKNQTRGRWILTKILLMMSGILVILLLPSAVFYYNEGGWTYLDCVYYALVSLATGGLGNLTNSHNMGDEAQPQERRWAYQAFTLLWFILGLGIISMVNSLAMETISQTSKKHQRSIRDKSAITRRRSDSHIHWKPDIRRPDIKIIWI